MTNRNWVQIFRNFIKCAISGGGGSENLSTAHKQNFCPPLQPPTINPSMLSFASTLMNHSVFVIVFFKYFFNIAINTLESKVFFSFYIKHILRQALSEVYALWTIRWSILLGADFLWISGFNNIRMSYYKSRDLYLKALYVHIVWTNVFPPLGHLRFNNKLT